MKSATRIAATIVLLALAPQVLHAVPITIDFEGTAVSTLGIWSGRGNAVTGSYTYDSALVDSIGTNENDFFAASAVANVAFDWNITITLGGLTQSSSDNANVPGTLHHFFQILDMDNLDSYWIQAPRLIAGDNQLQIRLPDSVPTPPDAIAIGTGNLTGNAPTLAPNLAAFSDNCTFADFGVCSGATSFDAVGTTIGG